MQKHIENVVMIVIKHLKMNQISALNNPWEGEMLLKK